MQFSFNFHCPDFLLVARNLLPADLGHLGEDLGHILELYHTQGGEEFLHAAMVVVTPALGSLVEALEHLSGVA